MNPLESLLSIFSINRIKDPYKDIDFLAETINATLCASGLGVLDPANPFRDIIKPGDVIVLKPNWVNHKNKTGMGMDCLITHPNFIAAVVRLISACNPRKIILGDAPIQGCDFNQVISANWMEMLKKLVQVPIEIIDFRRTIMVTDFLKTSLNLAQRPLDQFAFFDTGMNSYLEDVSDPDGRFRVSMYNHKFLKENHSKGIHRYLIAKEPLEANVFINLPKLKTHNKAGLTGAMKNLVGINGSKEFLPHHRISGSNAGGDCYSGGSGFKYAMEKLTDKMNQVQNSRKYQLYRYFIKSIMKAYRSLGFNGDLTGAWHGNDTVWRMVADLNKIFLYGNFDGTFASKPIRKIYSLTDAIIAGDHNGPLLPQPVPLGIITFSDSSPLVDLMHATLMGFDWKKIPTIRSSFENVDFQYINEFENSFSLMLNGQEIKLKDLFKTAGKRFVPAPGWLGHIEKM